MFLDSMFTIAPGLLRILRQAAWLRAGLVFLASVLYLALFPNKSALPFLAAVAIERSVFVALVHAERLQQNLQPHILRIAIGWLLAVPVIEIAIGIRFLDETIAPFVTQFDAFGVSSPLLWLVVPVILAAWQYGRRGLTIAIAVLVLEHIGLGIVLWKDLQFAASFLVNAGGRIAMLVILGYVVMHLVQAQRAEHAALEQANRQLAQRAATAEQLAESRERNRLARELHDTLAHSLTGLSVQLQALGTLLEHDPSAAIKQLRGAQTTVRNGVNEVRRSIQSLRATPLQDLGLSEALRQLCRAQAERTGAIYECHIDDVTALDPLTEQAVYRIASATLANVEQHAAATRVALSLRLIRANELQLEIEDNGVGFDAHSVPENRFGLVGIMERTKEVGGTCSIQSAEGKGTKLRLEIPLAG